MTAPDTSAPPTDKPERIAKRMARAGLCSRREAERWIAGGRVAVDGVVLESPAVTVTSQSTIEVDGETLGETPLAGVPLTAGLHIFRAHLPDGQVIEREVEISAENRFVVFEVPPPASP